MFNDKARLTQLVMDGIKEMTRRFVPEKIEKTASMASSEKAALEWMLRQSKYRVFEIVAIAQSYKDILEDMIERKGGYGEEENDFFEKYSETKGWNNKMFVKASVMPHHIIITDVKIERLQDISDDDCLKEGVLHSTDYAMPYGIPDAKAPNGVFFYYSTPQEAFYALLGKVDTKGNNEDNPWVYVYSFKRID